MFETEPILWLQAHGSPLVTGLLFGVSLLGYTQAYVVLLLALAFGVRLRPSLAVLVATILAATIVQGAKAGCAMPRPEDVDARVLRNARGAPVALVARGSAPDFWSLPLPDGLAAVRAQVGHDYGFPSGHVAAAAAFLLALARFFRSHRALAFAAFWVPVMALSRIYLGRHFPGDVLGGLAVGIAAVALSVPLVRTLEWGAFESRGWKGRLVLAAIALLPLGLAPFVPLLAPIFAGSLAGVLSCYAFLAFGRPWPEGGNERQRLARVALAGLICGLGSLLFAGQLDDATGWSAGPLLAGLLVTGATLIGTIVLSRRLRLVG